MIETHETTPKDTLKRYTFENFQPGLLKNLTNWEIQVVEEDRRWFLSHGESQISDKGNQMYMIEIFKPQDRIPGTLHDNRVNVHIQQVNHFYESTTLGVREFSVGRIGIGEPGEQEAVIFKGTGGKALTIRNDGSIFVEKSDSSAYFPLK